MNGLLEETSINLDPESTDHLVLNEDSNSRQ